MALPQARTYSQARSVVFSLKTTTIRKAAAWDITKWMWQQAAPPMMTETSVAGKVSEHIQHGQTKQGMKTEGMNVWPRIAGVNIYPV